jgi:hypothetical protein
MVKNINKIVNDVLKKSLENDKIKIPEWVKRVKIDVGTSLNAPNTEIWLNQDDELCVFGFEPNIHNINTYYTGNHNFPIKINPDKINKNFFYFNCALSNIVDDNVDFYCTVDDPGTSSLFKPKYTSVGEITKVSVIRLLDFFDKFPWEQIPHIDQLKIDAQSSDFNIIKGAGDYISEKVVFLDVEASTNNQYENNETPEDLKSYLEEKGFECVEWGMNARFRNLKFKNIFNNINYNFLND